MTSSVRPSTKYSASLPEVKAVNGSTATDFSGGPPSIRPIPPRITPVTCAAESPSTRTIAPSNRTSIRPSRARGASSPGACVRATVPSGARSNAQAMIMAMGRPSANRTSTSGAAQAGKLRVSKIVLAIWKTPQAVTV